MTNRSRGVGLDPAFTRSSVRLLAGSQFGNTVSLVFSNMVLDASSFLVAEGSTAAGHQIVLFPTTSSLTIDGAGTASPTQLVATHLGVGSDLYVLTLSASRRTVSGGDLVGAQPARLDLRAGAMATVRPSFGLSTTLSLGSQGQITLDPSSGIYVGNQPPPVPASGKITLGPRGELWGTGAINGVSFLSGTHLDVLNAGGFVHPGFSPGRLTIDGSYTQEDGVLELSIGGSTPVTGFSQLAASAGISITGGTIRFVREVGYNGDLGAVLTFLLSSNGVVDVLPGVAIDDQTGLGLAFDFATGSARITQLVPEPPVLAFLLAGFAGLAWIGRQRGSSNRGT